MLRSKIFVLMALIAMLVAACAPAVSAAEAPTPTGTEEPAEPVVSAAVVESVEVQLLESFPLQVRLVVRGTLPDMGCTTIASVEQEREGNTFKVDLVTTTDPLALCAQALTPFEEIVELDVKDLPAGEYTVNVNGVEETFVFPG